MAKRNPSTPKGKAPAFQFYAQDILADFNVLAMTLEEFGAYVKLLALCWNEHGIPADSDRIARVLAITRERFDQLSPAISPCFYLDESGRWQHKRLDEERRKQRKYTRAMQLNGLKGGRPQQSRGLAAGLQQQSRGLAEKSSSSSSSSSSSEVQDPARARGVFNSQNQNRKTASNPTYANMKAWTAECHELHADSCHNQREHVGKIRKAVSS